MSDNSTLEQLKRDLALQHPLNSYPTMLGAVGGAFYFLIDPIATVGIISIILASVGFGSVAINRFFRSDAFTLDAMQQWNAKQERDRIRELGQLDSKLDSEISRKQLSRINGKFTTFVDVLNERFTKGTITYGRFFGIAQEIFKVSVSRIEEIHLKEKQLLGIHRKSILNRLEELHQQDQSNANVKSEQASLESRLEIRKKIENRITEIIASNEQAITTFDMVMDQMAADECSERELSLLMSELESVSETINNLKQG